MSETRTPSPLLEAAVYGLNRWTPSPHCLAPGVLGFLSTIDRCEIAESVMNAVLDAQSEEWGVKGWWIDIDGHGDPTVWMPDNDRPHVGIAVTSQSAAGPALWFLLAALIPEKIVQDALLTCAGPSCGREYNPTEGEDEIFCSDECRRAEQAAHDDAEDEAEDDERDDAADDAAMPPTIDLLAALQASVDRARAARDGVDL